MLAQRISTHTRCSNVYGSQGAATDVNRHVSHAPTLSRPNVCSSPWRDLLFPQKYSITTCDCYFTSVSPNRSVFLLILCFVLVELTNVTYIAHYHSAVTLPISGQHLGFEINISVGRSTERQLRCGRGARRARLR